MYLCSVIFFFNLLLSTTLEDQNISTSRFTNKQDTLCDVQDRVDIGCSRREPKAGSLIQCTASCSMNRNCIGVSVDENSQCYLHDECPEKKKCSNTSSLHRFFSRCIYGIWNVARQSCKCYNGFRGAKCDQGFATCFSINYAGYTGDRHHRIFLDPDQDGHDAFPVYCKRSPGTNSYFVTIFRNHGKKDFNNTWDEYVHGFYYSEYHFWMGLENWRRAVNSRCKGKVMFFRYVINKYSKSVVFRKYKGLTLSANDYRLTYTSSTKDKWGDHTPYNAYFGNCLGPVTGVPFSTWDRDNDGVDETNCASRAGSGWWYKESCGNPCNVLGFGFSSFNSKPSYTLFSLLGVDMSSEKIQKQEDKLPFFEIFYKCT